MNRNLISTLSVLLILGCIGFEVIGQDAPNPTTPPAPAAPKPYKVSEGKFQIDLKISGILESTDTAEVAVKAKTWKTFKVVEVVEQGKKVKEGDVLVKFDTEDYEKALKDADRNHRLHEISVAQAEAEMAMFEYSSKNSLADTLRSKEEAEADYKYYFDVTRAQTLQSYKESLKSSQASLEMQQEELNQLKQMYKEDDLTEATEEIILKRQQRAVELAKIRYENAEKSYERTMSTTFPRREADLKRNHNRQMKSTDNTLKMIPLTLEQKRLGMEKTRIANEKTVEKYQDLKKDKEFFTIKAPKDGIVYYGKATNGKWSATVASRLVKDGEIKADEVFITIVNPKAIQLQASVTENQLYLANNGIAGIAKVSAYPDARLPVKVTSVNRIPTAGGSFATVLSIDIENAGNADHVLPGYAASANLIAYKNDKAITVPSSLIHREDEDIDMKYVYVKTNDDKVFKRPVNTGLSHGGKTEVVNGLKVGELIVPTK